MAKKHTLIPDSRFEQALIDLGIDTNPTIDGQVETANISGLIDLYINEKGITDLTGIEDFTALTDLNFSFNQLTNLDLSANIALIKLNCMANQLTSLDVSSNTSLTTLFCNSNQLTSLDISTNTALIELNCVKNQLTSLDVSANTILKSLSCWENQLTSLDVSSNTVLTYLLCANNQLTVLDVRNGNNTNIELDYKGEICFSAENNPNLNYILVDNAGYSAENWLRIDASSSFSE